MFTLLIMTIDILLAFFIVLTIIRLVRVICIRLKLMYKINSICKNKKYTLKKVRFPLTSIFYRSKKIDFTVTANGTVYHVKFISSLSSKKVYHFIDENSYVTYLKIFFVLPLAKKESESIHFSSYHRFPSVKKAKKENTEYDKYVLLFNPLPSEITYLAEYGPNQIAVNGSQIGDFFIYNGNGFCSLLQEHKPKKNSDF